MCFTNTTKSKKRGALYSEIRDTLRPFDVVFMKGNKLFSYVVRFLESRGRKYPNSDDFSHVGMIVTSDILDHPNVLPGRMYIWESTLSGPSDYGVSDINGNAFAGVQLRDLDELVEKYDAPNATTVACGKLINNPFYRLPKEEVRRKFTAFFNMYNGRKYDMNPYSLISAIFSCFRPLRKKIEEMCDTEGWIFCSELVALAYKHMDVYPATLNEKDVLPRDIANPETDTDKTPKVISEIIYITTPIHYCENQIM